MTVMPLHPAQWLDIVVAVLLADGLLYTLRSGLHFIARRNRNKVVVRRVTEMRPAALDGYRAAVKEGVRAPLG